MPATLLHLRRSVAALVVCAAPLGSQVSCIALPSNPKGCLLPPPVAASTPVLQPLRIAGELGAGAVGFTLGAEGGLLAASGVAYLVRGHGGEITTPGLKKLTSAILVAGGGLGAGTSAWLASRADGQSSRWGWDVGVSTVAAALAFKYAGWPLTPESRRRPMGRLRRMAPVWMSAVAATIAASATRERR